MGGGKKRREKAERAKRSAWLKGFSLQKLERLKVPNTEAL